MLKSIWKTLLRCFRKGDHVMIFPWLLQPFPSLHCFCEESWEGLEEPGRASEVPVLARKPPTASWATARPSWPNPPFKAAAPANGLPSHFLLPRSHDITITAPPYARHSNTGGPRHSSVSWSNARALPRHVTLDHGGRWVPGVLHAAIGGWVACSSSHRGRLSSAVVGKQGSEDQQQWVNLGEVPRGDAARGKGDHHWPDPNLTKYICNWPKYICHELSWSVMNYHELSWTPVYFNTPLKLPKNNKSLEMKYFDPEVAWFSNIKCHIDNCESHKVLLINTYKVWRTDKLSKCFSLRVSLSDLHQF